MSNFSRTINSLNSKLAITVVILALISVAALIVHNNKIRASGIAQDRFYQVREGELLRKVIKIEDITNIQSPEFPKGFQVKIKNVSSKPIYHITILVLLPETRPFRTGGELWFDLVYGNPKLIDSSTQLADLERKEQQEAAPIKPGESYLLEIEGSEAERLRKTIKSMFGNDVKFTNNLVLSFQVINFGDGTGYIIGQPYPSNRISLESPQKKLKCLA